MWAEIDMSYEKTQYGGMHYILLGFGLLMLFFAWIARADTAAALTYIAMAVVMVVVALMFNSLTVRDEGDCLAIRYGPLPAFRKRIRYADISSVEPGRTSIIDGWGIHQVPWRGTTYNLWGFGCVKLTLGKKVIRVGSDDVDNLVAFLRTKLAENSKTGLASL
jgi:hypothetical protein